jgi:hypothetical protein
MGQDQSAEEIGVGTVIRTYKWDLKSPGRWSIGRATLWASPGTTRLSRVSCR